MYLQFQLLFSDKNLLLKLTHHSAIFSYVSLNNFLGPHPYGTSAFLAHNQMNKELPLTRGLLISMVEVLCHRKHFKVVMMSYFRNNTDSLG